MDHGIVSALSARLPRQTAVIGGGGKSTMLLALAKHLTAEGHSVLLTTTTHLACPPPEWLAFSSPQSIEELNCLARPGNAVIAGYPTDHGRMTGIPAEWYPSLQFTYIIIEADGSKRLPVKVHNETEPVIPDGTGLVIQVTGLSGLYRTAEKAVHRYPLGGLTADTLVTPEVLARLADRGLERCGGLPVIQLFNQADRLSDITAFESAVQPLLKSEYLIGSLKEEGAPCWY